MYYVYMTVRETTWIRSMSRVSMARQSGGERQFKIGIWSGEHSPAKSGIARVKIALSLRTFTRTRFLDSRDSRGCCIRTHVRTCMRVGAH